jgi:transposase
MDGRHRVLQSPCAACSLFAARRCCLPLLAFACFSTASLAGILMSRQSQSTLLEMDMGTLDEALQHAEEKLSERDANALKAVVNAYEYLTELVEDKNTSIAKLRKMLFGSKTEKTAAVVEQESENKDSKDEGDAASNSATKSDACIATDPENGADAEQHEIEQRKGHGRNGADAYRSAEKIEVSHESLKPGDACPKCEEGTVYETNRPGVLVRLIGQPPVSGKVYYLQKLRCGLCGKLFTALPPADAGNAKYDATVGAMIGLLKYGTGMPFNRAENLQQGLGIPLPASTQWDIVEALAERAEPVFQEFINEASQGDVVHNDDTTVKILEMMGARARQAALAEEAVAEADRDGPGAQKTDRDRTGMFTSGIVSTREGRKIVLFLSGRQHAGENLKDVLERRAKELPQPIQMCDALARNAPAELQTILANCLAHGRRQFVDVANRFPGECRHVLESLAVVYRNEAQARKQKMSPQDRLVFHQTQSGPVMEELHAWLARQIDERHVEPNSALGSAMAYMLRHWKKLTVFLRVAGAPLDNNVCERALKKAILHRKNAYFYKSEHGAHVGDVFMSLIHTCELSGESPFDYLVALDRHAARAALKPQDWMPWNYRDTVKEP